MKNERKQEDQASERSERSAGLKENPETRLFGLRREQHTAREEMPQFRIRNGISKHQATAAQDEQPRPHRRHPRRFVVGAFHSPNGPIISLWRFLLPRLEALLSHLLWLLCSPRRAGRRIVAVLGTVARAAVVVCATVSAVSITNDDRSARGVRGGKRRLGTAGLLLSLLLPPRASAICNCPLLCFTLLGDADSAEADEGGDVADEEGGSSIGDASAPSGEAVDCS
jgi:hypothetical protein